MNFAPTVMKSHAAVVIVVNVAMIGLTIDGRNILRNWLFSMRRRGRGMLVLSLPLFLFWVFVF